MTTAKKSVVSRMCCFPVEWFCFCIRIFSLLIFYWSWKKCIITFQSLFSFKRHVHLLPAFSCMVVFLFYCVGLHALWFPLPVFFHQSVILYVIYTVWIIAWFNALLCWGFLTDLCLLDTFSGFTACILTVSPSWWDVVVAFTWIQSVLLFFNCCKHPKKVEQLVYFVAATLSGTCIDFPQEYFAVIAVIAIFYIVQRKLFDTWFTAWLCVSIYSTLYIGFIFFFSFLLYLIWTMGHIDVVSLFNTFNI